MVKTIATTQKEHFGVIYSEGRPQASLFFEHQLGITMALYINDTGPDRPVEFHVSSLTPRRIMSNRQARNVIEAQADGHELAAIYHQFPNIPKSKGSRVVNWFGDHAKFIAANLYM